jgi:hypothetical protein
MVVCLVCPATHAQQEDNIWPEFVAELKNGQFSPDQIRPYEGISKSTMFGFLSQMRKGATWSEWETPPESHRVGNQVHYLVPLTYEGSRQTFCFTFLTENGKWYFQHLESITIRLDKTGPPPVSTFPDIPETQKAWMRDEILVSEQVRLFAMLAKEKGREFALNWFKDGAGYLISARTWVPFVPVSRAFILYLCWEQANLRGNKVTLERLDDREATVTLEPHYLKMYSATEHLRREISAEDYRDLFESIWQDRAEKAGWKLQITYKGTTCVFQCHEDDSPPRRRTGIREYSHLRAAS